MKTKLIPLIGLLAFAGFAINGCSESAVTPSGPAATVNATMTAEALQTAGPNAQATATAQAEETATYESFYATATAIIQITSTAIALQTAGPNAQATATSQAVATQNMLNFQATQTAIVIAPEQTAVAEEVLFDSSAILSVPGGTYIQSDDVGTYQDFSHTISAFKMGKYEVTYNLWFIVYRWAIANGYNFANAGTEGNDGLIGAVPTAAKHEPVSSINWRDAIVWCNAFSQKVGLTPCYTYSGVVIKDSMDTNSMACDNAVCDWSANGYRLPTEGEWQYAASYINGSSWQPCTYASGATADYSNAAATGNVAWYSVNSGSVTHNVASKTANSIGIYDMSGNELEWCWDWLGDYPNTSTNYLGATSGTNRVLRGGRYNGSAGHAQVGIRDSNQPYLEYSYIGFRFARTY